MSSEVGLREKQYIDVSKIYLNNLNRENSLQIELVEKQRLIADMKEATEKQKYLISKGLLEVQNDINNLIIKMVGIELRDYRREYVDSVKAF